MGARRGAAQTEVKLARKRIEDAGLHLPPATSLMLNQPYMDGYQNVGISPLHVLKKLYWKVLSLHVNALFNACDSREHFHQVTQVVNRL